MKSCSTRIDQAIDALSPEGRVLLATGSLYPPVRCTLRQESGAPEWTVWRFYDDNERFPFPQGYSLSYDPKDAQFALSYGKVIVNWFDSLDTALKNI